MLLFLIRQRTAIRLATRDSALRGWKRLGLTADAHQISSESLGLVHGLIGISQKVSSLSRMIWNTSKPCAHSHIELFVADSSASNRFPNNLSDRLAFRN